MPKHQPLAAPSAFDTGAYNKERPLGATWMEHVKAYATKHGLTHAQAMSTAGPSWKKQKGGNRLYKSQHGGDITSYTLAKKELGKGGPPLFLDNILTTPIYRLNELYGDAFPKKWADGYLRVAEDDFSDDEDRYEDKAEDVVLGEILEMYHDSKASRYGLDNMSLNTGLDAHDFKKLEMLSNLL